MQKFLTFALLLLAAFRLEANSGIWRGSINVNLDGNVVNYKDQTGTGTTLSGANLGTITNASTFRIEDPYLFSWKNGGCDVYDARMYYRVYKQGGTPGSYQVMDLDLNICTCGSGCWRSGVASCSTNDQEWGNPGGTIDLLAAALAADGSAGTYVLEVYWETNVQSGDCGTTTRTTTAVSATFVASTSLPIELANFQASQKGSFVDLNWRTFSEINHDRFEIERSSDGANWAFIGQVKSQASDMNRSQDYIFRDEKPLSGVNYYRLKIMDKNGGVEYSKAVKVLFSGRNNMTVSPN
ncbi:MAG: hypothetical protein IT269_12415, partial [Saprospiraceae bacterium]|nr:hypothetical protein [Saprospiraceae bacterium]